MDFDDLPPDASLAGVHRELVALAPALADVPMLLVPSASSNIVDSRSETELRGLTGVHAYLWLEHAADAPEIGCRLRERAILAAE